MPKKSKAWGKYDMQKIFAFFAFLGALSLALVAVVFGRRNIPGIGRGIESIRKGLDDSKNGGTDLASRERDTKSRLDNQTASLDRAESAIDDGLGILDRISKRKPKP